MTTANADEVGRRRPAVRGGGEALRAEILQAAGAILSESGDIGQVTLRGVARRVGIAATSIYLHFQDVTELLIAVKQQWFTDLTAMLSTAAEQAGTEPADRIRAMGHAYVGHGHDEPGKYRVLFSGPIHAPMVPEPIAYLGSAAFVAICREAGALLGVAEDDPKAQLLAVDLWCAFHGVVHLRSMKTTFPWPELSVQVDDIIDRML